MGGIGRVAAPRDEDASALTTHRFNRAYSAYAPSCAYGSIPVWTRSTGCRFLNCRHVSLETVAWLGGAEEHWGCMRRSARNGPCTNTAITIITIIAGTRHGVGGGANMVYLIWLPSFSLI